MKSIFTCGDINGIGPEIILKTIHVLQQKSKDKTYIAIPGNVFNNSLQFISKPVRYEIVKDIKDVNPNPSIITVIDIGKFKQKIGVPTKESGAAAYAALEMAFDFLYSKQIDAMITAPISKEAVNSAGYKIPGHTELLAKWCNIKDVVMMFISSSMKAALLTIHIPIKKVSKTITTELLKAKTEIIVDSLKKDFGIENPAIAVLGINPHAGENGLIGEEEELVIKPFIKNNSTTFFGPFPPDAFFAHKTNSKYDLIIGNYHDQLLIPFKMLNPSEGVNYTAGLPIIRTSPDHGTAFDIAGKGIAEYNSLLQSYLTAKRVHSNRKKFNE
jgi:4-hydroxythreonine-4-phosphate dehydrogenase